MNAIPVGATHKLRGEFYAEFTDGWFRFLDGVWVNVDQRSWDFVTRHAAPITDKMRQEVAAQAWNGVGLPPVGTVCEFKANILGWVEATITAVTALSIVFTRPSYQNGRPLVEERLPHKAVERFRPIRTPEQIAAEEREKAIAEMAETMRVATGFGINLADAAALYDAGYRKQVAP